MSALLDSLLIPTTGSPAAGVKLLKALAWARVSTDMQEERGLSIPEQQRQIREYAADRGIEIVEEYHEAANAFRKESQRIEFHKMLNRAKSESQINTILVHDFSRFSRDSLQARTLLRDLRKAGVTVISLNDLEADPETVAGVYLEAITFAKNEAYSREVAFHTRKGCRANIQTRDPETGWCYKNGGQPLFGYKAERLVRGGIKKGRPLIKAIWVPDDRVVAGRTIAEWAKHCLNMAANGASLDQLRDFCNKQQIPAPRKEFWGHTTWNSILDPHCLLQFAGYGVWNVRGKNQRTNPPSDWVIVENAQEALISEDLAAQIIDARLKTRNRRFDKGYSRSRNSRYLLSGGLFTCGRCGSNLLGMKKTQSAHYYICGSQPHRKGLGCGTAVYVPQAQVESEVLSGLMEMLNLTVNAESFTRKVNRELKKLWESSQGVDPALPHKLKAIDQKIDNIRKAVEDGLPDIAWANKRMKQLLDEREILSAHKIVKDNPPKLDTRTVMAYRENVERLLSVGTETEKKQILRSAVESVKLFPDTLEVEITFRVPETIGAISGSGGWI